MSHNKNNRNKSKQTEPRSLADIVREKTNDGKVIVDFYLDVVRGKLDDEGFEVCHRLEAAEQLQAVAPGLVSEYIAQLTGVECGHAILRKRTRDLDCIPREDREPLPSRDSRPRTPRGPRIPRLGTRRAFPEERPPRRRHRPREHRPRQDRRQLPPPRNARRSPRLQAPPESRSRQ